MEDSTVYTSRGIAIHRMMNVMSKGLVDRWYMVFFFFQAEDGIRDYKVTGVQTCALPIWPGPKGTGRPPGGERPQRRTGQPPVFPGHGPRPGGPHRGQVLGQDPVIPVPSHRDRKSVV